MKVVVLIGGLELLKTFKLNSQLGKSDTVN